MKAIVSWLGLAGYSQVDIQVVRYKTRQLWTVKERPPNWGARTNWGSLADRPHTLHPTPYTLHPTPYTPHPTPYTLHLTPHTLHPTPYTLGVRDWGAGCGEGLDLLDVLVRRGARNLFRFILFAFLDPRGGPAP